ncbi:aldehyde dehydrogenase (NADP(+)) [Saccharothrix longispora]|uniref:NADP-dependent aldehyde dehydrogenase n=1 Tax=Saccharothrix longispora TaxID=33920 RepID=A0ABU1Q8D6_9PSEU|nr:aldehyde dehydrogenase (NADP(+)) [Saccharothrix longispora]MDR6598971.1 NADP-dependent aldehyde dehydrogenase [Saccharothrix longispora]
MTGARTTPDVQDTQDVPDTRGVRGVQGYNPRTGEPSGPPIPESGDTDVDRVVTAAAAAFPTWSALPARDRADALESVADALDAGSEALVTLADTETALGRPRLTTELKRTTNQLRLFAEVLREGSWVEATLDTANPDIIPPRPVLRRMLRPLGPVGVFAASNFPFAFSIAGGDTASALAAGCPVVVKAHPSHPGTSEATARIVESALPPGVFGVVHGQQAGVALVNHPAVKAVGFTGSTAGGRALFDLASSRPEPIPFYGELGSINPAVVLPRAAAARPEGFAAEFAGSLTLGVGQFCTNPGLLFAPESLVPALAAAVSGAVGGPMLNERMCDAYRSGTEDLAASGLARLVARGTTPAEGWSVEPKLYQVPLAGFAENLATLTEEHFGPAAVVVTYSSVDELLDVLPKLPGTLTGAVHAAEAELADAGRVAEALRPVVGRLIFNGWPTGVAVAWGMHHGGPWPSTTNALHTSVGATSIRRWVGPVTYQSWPDELLPAELRDGNPLGIPRRVDGVLAVH